MKSPKRRRKTPEELKRMARARKISYFHPENNLDFIASLEDRRTQDQLEELDALNDIFRL